MQTVVANKLTRRVHAYQCAVGAIAGRGTLTVPGGRTESGFVQVFPDDSEASVEIVSLDGIVDTFHVPPIDLLKIDVEGAELDVLQGATQTIPSVRRMIVEYHSSALRDEALHILTNAGFTCTLRFKVPSDDDFGFIYMTR